MYDILARRNEPTSKEALAWAQRLVSTPSASLSEGDLANEVQKQMTRLGYEQVVRDSFGNVVGTMLGREAGPTVLLACHMDTTIVGEEGDWDAGPYEGAVRDGKLWGRGASDCKAGLAAQVYSGALLKRSLLPLQGNLVVAATVGEEQGGSVGMRALMEKTIKDIGLSVDYALLGEPTELGLYYGHDGWVELEVRVEGANMFDVGDAAAALAADFNARRGLSKAKDREDLASEAPHYEQLEGRRRATIGLRRRVNEADDIDAVLSQVQREAVMVTQSIGEVAVQVAVRQDNQRLYTGTTTAVRRVTHAWAIDPFCHLMSRARQSLAAAGCEVRAGKWQLGRLGMGTAGGVLTNEYNIPTIGYGPGNEDSAHAVNEWVEVDKVCQAVYGTAAIVHSLIGVPVFGWTGDEI